MKFRKFSASCQGKKYFEKGWACQDSSGTLDFEKVQVIAVADGHGSSDCFRSATGSKLAVKILFEQIKKFCETSNISKEFGDTGIKNFKFEFVSEWKKAVKNDWEERLKNVSELGEGELRYKSVSEKYKARYTSEPEKYLYTAYGTTLICAVSIGKQILFLQIGDGSCVVLQKDGEFKIPVPPEEENFLNVTVSLCEEKSELKIRHAILNCDEESPSFPAAIFLSTDGLDDCFEYHKNEEHLYKFYADVLLENILQFGFDSTEEEIKSQLLPGMTKRFSQDDISLAYFVVEDLNLLKEIHEKIDRKYKSEKISEPPKIQKEISTETKISEIKKVEEKIFTDTKVTESKGLPVNFSVKNFSGTGTKILRASEYLITTDTKIIPVYTKI